MGLFEKYGGKNSVSTNKNGGENVNESELDIFLTIEDLNLLLSVIRTAYFPVKDIDRMYKLILKLQQIRSKLENNG